MNTLTSNGYLDNLIFQMEKYDTVHPAKCPCAMLAVLLSCNITYCLFCSAEACADLQRILPKVSLALG